ncbi:exosortase family protein XrtF [Aurantibacter aestuarii]|uniref:Exosortase family protein XrtF n=1 Tax=Aurantibacter aestuarii TaxID=1266046 RepID=A0A2T1NEI8_9FLAO|nr:exosortase family protein XrtF [Aurantibacter aestuarii]PSG90819.1 exosortase family protein XrtF [Aurantibacter aestuarii]
MASLLKEYRPVLKFIATFLGVYFLFTLAYKFYLDFSDGSLYYPDYFSNLVGQQTVKLLEVFGYDASLIKSHEPVLNLVINNKNLAFISEGCNGISIIILFASFIISFSKDFKTTFIYIISGSVLIYIANLIRIVIIAIALYHYPWREEILHNVIFPGLIYSMVFVLWMFWVYRFNKTKS